MMKKAAAESKTSGMKLDPHTACVVNHYQGKVMEFYSEYKLALDVIQVLDSRNYFQCC